MKIVGDSGGFPLEAVQESQLCSPSPTNRAESPRHQLCLPRWGHTDASSTRQALWPPSLQTTAASQRGDLICPGHRASRSRSGRGSKCPGPHAPPHPTMVWGRGRESFRGMPRDTPSSAPEAADAGTCCHHGERRRERDGCLVGTQTLLCGYSGCAVTRQLASRSQECQQDT